MSTRRLGKVTNPQGRLDVLLYQLVSRTMERIERERNVVGICEHVLPIVEELICANVPARNLIPRELAAVMRVCELNRRRVA